jgi:hypothetical protein
MKRQVIASTLLIFATVCHSKEPVENLSIATAKAAVSRKMKDPSSTQFRELTLYDHNGIMIVCGEVNAKNSYGAYDGYFPFVSVDGAVFTADSTDDPHVLSAFEGAHAMFCSGQPVLSVAQ